MRPLRAIGIMRYTEANTFGHAYGDVLDGVVPRRAISSLARQNMIAKRVDVGPTLAYCDPFQTREREAEAHLQPCPELLGGNSAPKGRHSMEARHGTLSGLG